LIAVGQAEFVGGKECGHAAAVLWRIRCGPSTVDR
jgi:hypothetical protein